MWLALLSASNSLQTIIRPLNCARDNNSTSKGAAAAAPTATASMIIFQNLFYGRGTKQHSAWPSVRLCQSVRSSVVRLSDGLTAAAAAAAVGHPTKALHWVAKLRHTPPLSLSPSPALLSCHYENRVSQRAGLEQRGRRAQRTTADDDGGGGGGGGDGRTSQLC